MARRPLTPVDLDSASLLRLPDPTATREGELAKSRRTRLRILEGTVECLADLGYAGTNTGAVAMRVGMTRPAIHYHFATKAAMIEAAIYYILRVRLDLYLRDIKTLRQREDMVDVAWAHLQTDAFRAFCELLMVAHTDEDVAAVFGPALAEYDRARRDVSLATFPREEIEAPWFNLRRDVFRFLIEGLAMQGGMSYDAERRRNAILTFMKVLLHTEIGEVVFGAAVEEARPAARRALKRSPGRSLKGAAAPDDSPEEP